MTTPAPWTKTKTTALLVLADGTVIEGVGAGATGAVEAEVCFNTAITGYQEILTDPSYAGQIVTFTFPHIGNVGANDDDVETLDMEKTGGVAGAIFKEPVTDPSNYRSASHFNDWMTSRGIIALHGIDTRALTAHIRETGLANAVIAHEPSGEFDIDALKKRAANWSGLEGTDLAPGVTSSAQNEWSQKPWVWDEGYSDTDGKAHHIVAMDFGVKRNILRLFAGLDCKVTVVPASTSADDILALKPDGIFLSNGPGDPAATGDYAVPAIQGFIESGLPIFGICLGHQMLALALGGKTVKMHQGHHGANHPVKDHTTGKVEIVSMNHGFAVDGESLPAGVEETHISLFDGTNCGLRVTGKPVFGVQHHPEASPGPQDSHYLFRRFVNLIRQTKGEAALAESA
ncbi:glutamine-hydrolyzing carbamoyl-phosphate synthase small subunit [Ahrensia sp. R2A130]|uniref:glutamine-hydrolyzing carbamoyl-phosphate synthase small subunit n=1 Tax=Ahrensia sp. R2A130 TaxID=744979 RepID=UPI0001E08390|nr:glutamine-hydrolyzing carbamoyl-phosphate synthase small subunit [Ahrensia sp. R2A130]EFL91044.1 carbamoyl-phosphate synthase, small subunit [Ahrensia sp. R2A130]